MMTTHASPSQTSLEKKKKLFNPVRPAVHARRMAKSCGTSPWNWSLFSIQDEDSQHQKTTHGCPTNRTPEHPHRKEKKQHNYNYYSNIIISLHNNLQLQHKIQTNKKKTNTSKYYLPPSLYEYIYNIQIYEKWRTVQVTKASAKSRPPHLTTQRPTKKNLWRRRNDHREILSFLGMSRDFEPNCGLRSSDSPLKIFDPNIRLIHSFIKAYGLSTSKFRSSLYLRRAPLSSTLLVAEDGQEEVCSKSINFQTTVEFGWFVRLSSKIFFFFSTPTTYPSVVMWKQT